MEDRLLTLTPTFGIRPPVYRLPSSAHIGRVRLAVSSLARSVDFYSRVVGLLVRSESAQLAKLGTREGRVLLELEQANVQPIGRRTRLGLYHTAFLLPSREGLSSFVQHLSAIKVPFGAGDHLYSEALYITDPDGLSVEIYADRDRSTWTVDGNELISAVDPVRFDTFPSVEADSWKGIPEGTTMGHIHLYVGDLEVAKRFYHAGLGLDLTTWRYPGALFTSAGGYHHHVGLNVWAAGSPIASKSDARLLFWELVLPKKTDIRFLTESMKAVGHTTSLSESGTQRFTDPWGITVAVATEGRSA
jgi:catechol 2,3-dioxygenase